MGLKVAKYWAKTALALTVLSGCAIYGVLCSVVLSLIGKRHLAQWSTARVFYWCFSKALGIRIRLINGERLENLPAIIVGNHQSTLDILILGRIFPQGCTVTSKKSLKWLPFLGWFMTLSGTFYLDRSSKEQSVRTLNKALKELKDKKRGLYLFPEGTRSYAQKPMLLPFKKGAFHLAQQGDIPIIPIVVSNTSSLINHKTRTFETGEIIIKVLEPVSTDGLLPSQVSAFSENIRQSMLKEVELLGFSVPDNEKLRSELRESDEATSPNETDLELPKADAERIRLLDSSDSL